jgi:predicted ATPase
MDRIFFENIRCFATRQEVPLAPLTVLVGENSSGKSTVLALVRLAWHLTQNNETPNFNEEPFLLGAYEQIVARNAMETRGSFLVGIEASVQLGLGEKRVRLTVSFGSRAGQPVVLDWRLESPEDGLVLQYAGKSLLLNGKKLTRVSEDEQLSIRAFEVLWRTKGSIGSRPYAFAPVRTRPQRTYDPITGIDRPEGSHVPMILASASLTEPERWREIFSALDAFGSQSGLFSKVEVRRLGQSEGDPFQIQVHVGGNAVNLIDVGYGVSQVLPIVVDCLRGEEGGTFLLQQPEVHLHPRAQAELGSFLGVLAKQQKKRFVIETHSDYLVDRIRMDIRDGKGLKPEDVSLLYFERKNGQANIHRLTLDEHGNLLDPPPGYRDFFLGEERRFLGG